MTTKMIPLYFAVLTKHQIATDSTSFVHELIGERTTTSISSMSGSACKPIDHVKFDRAFRQCSGMGRFVVLETWGLVSNGEENKWSYPLPDSESLTLTYSREDADMTEFPSWLPLEHARERYPPTTENKPLCKSVVLIQGCSD